jgi:hypothetical protein
MNAYGIKHKTTGLFFGGFNNDNTPRWVPEVKACGMSMEGAKGQAALFARFDIPVQKKPVAL